MKKVLALTLILCLLIGCDFFTGKKITNIDPETGKKTVTYEDAPIEDWVKVLGLVIPGLGVAGAAVARIARNTARTRDAIYDTNEEAIKNADWKKINTAKSVKLLLKTAQDSHKDAKLLGKTFEKWNTKRKNSL